MKAFIKSYILMTVFLVFVIAVGYLFSYLFQSPGILYFAIIFSLLMNFFAYWFSDKVALLVSRAKPLPKAEAPHIYEIGRKLTAQANLPMPRFYIINDPSPNAFATGRSPKNAAVALTSGLLTKLDLQELEAVLSHELSHIKNRDILVSSIAVVLAGVVAILADIFFRMMIFGSFVGGDDRRGGNILAMAAGLIAIIIAPLAATLLRLAISRQREFAADISGAKITKKPNQLANALIKISSDPHPLKHANNATAHLYITNPFRGKKSRHWLVKLFSTHPPVEERVKNLQKLKL